MGGQLNCFHIGIIFALYRKSSIFSDFFECQFTLLLEFRLRGFVDFAKAVELL